MKKLLLSLMSLALVSTPIISTISCGNNNGDNKGGKNDELTNEQQRIFNSLEFMSRAIVSSRHENLNINLNQMLSCMITPRMTAEFFPRALNIDKESIAYTQIDNYIKELAPIFSLMDQDKFGGAYASYIMKMYTDDFYGQDGNAGFNDTWDKGATNSEINIGKAQGYYSGYGKEMKLDSNSADLSWGIQDTGALTNYFLNKGYYGDKEKSTSVSNGPKTFDPSPTNGAGWLYYNTVIANGGHGLGDTSKNAMNEQYWKNKNISLTKSFDFKDSFIPFLREVTYKEPPKIKSGEFKQPTEFDSAGVELFASIGDSNKTSRSTTITSVFDSVNNTEDGLTNMCTMMDYLFPIFIGDEDLALNVSQGLPFYVMSAMAGIINKDETFKSKYSDKIKNYNEFDKSKLKLEEYFSKNGENSGVNGIKGLVDSINEILSNEDSKKHLADLMKSTDNDNGFYQNFNVLIRAGVDKSSFTKAFSTDKQVLQFLKGIVDAFSSMCDLYKDGSNSEIAKKVKKLNPNNKLHFSSLDHSQQLEFMKDILGYDGNLSNDTLMGKLYKGFSEMCGKSDNSNDSAISILLSALTDETNQKMKKPYNDSLKYISEEKYWKKSKIKFTKNGAKDKGNKLSFEVNYTGEGDSTSKASQVFSNNGVTSKDLVKKNFNPYQTEVPTIDGPKIDKTKKVGVQGLANLDDSFGKTDSEKLINYDGKGNYEDYKPVNFKYKIEWTNVGNENRPYWVMTKCDAFNQDGKQFYNIF